MNSIVLRALTVSGVVSLALGCSSTDEPLGSAEPLGEDAGGTGGFADGNGAGSGDVQDVVDGSPSDGDETASGGGGDSGSGSAAGAGPNSGESGGSTGSGGAPMQGPTVTLRGEVWADNWSALYLDGALVMEDSVSITTERSFNGEVFEFQARYPFTLAFVLKDYTESNSGLEYIGRDGSLADKKAQQIGDGGYIAQFTDVDSGNVVAVTDENVRCTVIFRAPLNPSCETSGNPDADCLFELQDEPQGWKAPGFDDSGWDTAKQWSIEEVSPKDGYDEINWDSSAQLIWSDDLRLDNTVLCRLTVVEP